MSLYHEDRELIESYVIDENMQEMHAVGWYQNKMLIKISVMIVRLMHHLR